MKSSSSPFSSSNPPSRILIRGVNWIGDAVMTMPAVQRIKELWPKATLWILVPNKHADLWLGNQFLDSVCRLPDSAGGTMFRDASFDLGIVFPNSIRSVMETSKLKCKRRVGYAGHWPRKYLLTDIVPEEFRDPPPQYSKTPPLQIHHYLGLVKYLGGNAEPCPPKIYLGPDELEATQSKFFPPPSVLRPPSFFVLCPGAEYGPAKRWLPDRFAEVARRVRAETGCQWILVGGPADRAVCEEIAAKIGDGATNLAGKTTLRELCCVLAQCKLLLTNDTGPMHLASALGTRVVAIFGSTDPVATGPYGDDHTIIRHPVECSPCFLRECPIDFRCMNRISAEEVVNAVLKTATNLHG